MDVFPAGAEGGGGGEEEEGRMSLIDFVMIQLHIERCHLSSDIHA